MQVEFENDESLAYFQSKLLFLLDSPISEAELIETLKTDPKLSEFRAYIESWEPRMVDLARRLTNKWGVKSG